MKVGDPVATRQVVGRVADLGSNTHFHFGYQSALHAANSAFPDAAGVGAIPQSACDGYPAFPERFIDPETVIFR